jgi:type I restriction enzyme S subunit
MPESASNNGWTRVAFGDVVRLSRERSINPQDDGFGRYVGLEHIEPGDLRIRRWGDTADGTTFTTVFRPGQILFGKRRAYQRKVAIADFDGVCSGDVYVLEPKNERVLPELLAFICQTDAFFEHAVATSAGSLSPRTNWDSLASFEFALPPLAEQRRIADLLGAAERTRETYATAAVVGRRLLSALATEMLGQHLLEPSRMGITLSTRVGWAVTSFEEVCERITYGFTNPMPTTVAGPWMVTAADVQDGRINYSTARHTSQQAFDRALTDKSRARVGDVLLTKDGTLGRVGVVDQRDVCINQSVALLRPSAKVLPTFLSWTLRAPLMQQRLLLEAGGSAVKHIYITKVARTRLLLPPLLQQEGMVRALEGAEASIRLIEDREAAHSRMMHSWLGSALAAER